MAAAAQNGTWKPPYVLKDQDITKTVQAPAPQSLQSESIASLKRVLNRTATRGNAKSARVSGDVVGVAALATYVRGGDNKTVSWFVGSAGELAFAIAIEGPYSASSVAAAFLRGIPAKARTGTGTGG